MSTSDTTVTGPLETHTEPHGMSVVAPPSATRIVEDDSSSADPTADIRSTDATRRPHPVLTTQDILDAQEIQVQTNQADAQWTHTPVELRPYLSTFTRVMMFFGYGRRASKARRKLVSLIWNLVWGTAQVVTIITFLVLTAHKNSPTFPDKTEWQVCNRPLAVWDIIWIIRIVFTSGISIWGWSNDIRRPSELMEDTESGRQRLTATPANRTEAATAETADSRPTTSNVTPQQTEQSILHVRLSLISSTVAVIWFLTAHFLLYTSLNSCRIDAPFLWWTTFGVLCVMYLVILEVLLLGIAVIFIAPIIFLFWNLLLLLLGRHPMQNPSNIRPEISKLPKSVVDTLPLVIYIPPPPDEPTDSEVKIPEAAYQYPPKPKAAPKTPKFAFLRKALRRRKKTGANGAEKSAFESDKTSGQPHQPKWEDRYEKSEFPFVRLEGNRAACAICLMDFEEPSLVGAASDENALHLSVAGPTEPGIPVDTLKEAIQSEDEADGEEEDDAVSLQLNPVEELKLEDAGDGSQPLRLLFCGHIFHKTCVDPWLTDVSGRCPVCQRPVEFPVHSKQKRRRRNRQP